MGGTDMVADRCLDGRLHARTMVCAVCGTAGGAQIIDGIFSWGQYCKAHPNVYQTLSALTFGVSPVSIISLETLGDIPRPQSPLWKMERFLGPFTCVT